MMTTSFASSDQSHPLNNGYHCRIVEKERVFSSVEQYMMWYKAKTFPGNDSVMDDIMATADYTTIKSLGRAVVNFDPTVWSNVVETIVERGCDLKVSQNPEVMAYLLASRDSTIEQWNEADPTWSAPGKNLLGTILMRVRTRLWHDVLV